MIEPNELPANTDVVVIGAGPAGSTAASLLHRAGYRVCIIERESFPRFVIGESLLPRCMDLLQESGLLACVQQRGYFVKRGALFLRGSERSDFAFAEQFTAGWDHTFQVPRADFDLTLANAVAQAGVPIFYRHVVESCDTTPTPRVVIRTPTGEIKSIDCRFIVDASGYGRVLARLFDLEIPSHQPKRQAVFSHVRGDARPQGPDEGRIWICSHPTGEAWSWVIPFSDGVTSVGVVAAPEVFAKYPGTLDQQLRAMLEEDLNIKPRLQHAEFVFPARALSGYSAAVKQLHGPGYCLVGNATEFLDPVFSSGVTLALESANRAAKTLIAQLGGAKVDWDVDYSAYMLQGIDTFRTYVNSWYDGSLPAIFYSQVTRPEIRRQICSVLSGYVWDMDNPFVSQHARRVPQLARIVTGM